MISLSLGWVCPQGRRPTMRTCSTSGWLRHVSMTPSPTMPEPPVIIALIFIFFFLRGGYAEVAKDTLKEMHLRTFAYPSSPLRILCATLQFYRFKFRNQEMNNRPGQ